MFQRLQRKIRMAKQVTLDTLFQAKVVGNPLWSPDSKWVVLTITETVYEHNTTRTTLWLMSADGKELFQLTSGMKADGSPATDSFPRWSPDGKCIAFYSNRSGSTQIYLINPFGGEAMPLTNETTGCGAMMTDLFFAGTEWSPDGAQIAFVAQLPEPKEKPKSDVKVVGVEYGEGYANVKSRMHVWTIDVPPFTQYATRNMHQPKAKQLTRGDYHHGDPRWSPDGKWIVFVSNRSGDEEAVTASINKNYDLWLMPGKGGAAKRLTTNKGPDYSPRWSPDGNSIAYLACPRCGSHADVFNLCVLDVGSGKSRNLTADFDYRPENLPSQCWSRDGKMILFSVGIGTRHYLFRAPTKGGSLKEVTDGKRFVYSPALSPNDKLIACVTQDENTLTELEIRNTQDARQKTVTRFNDWLQDYRLGASEVITWESDEFTIEGLLIKPPGYKEGKRYPMIVIPHGGPHSRTTFVLNLGWQLLAANGYVILAPNFRGTVGYGQAFIDADRADFGGGDFRDIMRGVDKLIADGIADPKRLGIFGGSYGGFMTMWSVGNTERFKAAVAVCSVTNLQSMFGTTDIKSWSRWEFFGYPWERFDDYVRCSPITHVHKVKTPTLLMHGENDIRVPISQSAEFYSALKARRVPTQFVRYPNEGHAISQPQHARDYWERVLGWFEKHL